MPEYSYSRKLWEKQKTVSYDSLAHTLHSQDPLGQTVRQLLHTWWLHILHWLEKTVSRLRGSRHRPQIRWLYLPLPRFAPFLFTSSNSVFSFLRQKETTTTSCKCYRKDSSFNDTSRLTIVVRQCGWSQYHNVNIYFFIMWTYCISKYGNNMQKLHKII